MFVLNINSAEHFFCNWTNLSDMKQWVSQHFTETRQEQTLGDVTT